MFGVVGTYTLKIHGILNNREKDATVFMMHHWLAPDIHSERM